MRGAGAWWGNGGHWGRGGTRRAVLSTANAPALLLTHPTPPPCRTKCMEDLQSTTRYVTWSLHTKSRSSLKAMLS